MHTQKKKKEKKKRMLMILSTHLFLTHISPINF